MLVGPVVHHWYGTLMKYIPGISVGAVLKRTFCDQAFFAPVFQPTFMFSLMMLKAVEGGSISNNQQQSFEKKAKCFD